MITTDNVTFCIKTIHRPWACHRLVQSLRKFVDDPKIIVVDDGNPRHRFSSKYPETAAHCRVINLDSFDVGVGIGRNTAVDAVETPYIFMLDDDHVVTPNFHFDRVLERFEKHKLDILAVRQGSGGKPTLFSLLMKGRRIWLHRGEHKRVSHTVWCDHVSNAFLARRDCIADLRWDESLKTYEHWEFFYRASKIEGMQIAVATDCFIRHAHVESKDYRPLRNRAKYRSMGLKKHGFHSMRFPGGGVFRA